MGRPIARETDIHEGVCTHGISCCPHNVTGTIEGHSPTTQAEGLGVARLGDEVVHDCPHCGTGYISDGCAVVTTDGLPTARLGDEVTYPGGSGIITTGSDTVSCC